MFIAVRIAAAFGITLALGLFDIVARPAQAQDAAQAQGEPMRLPVDAAPLVAETAKGPKQFAVEVADDAAERSAGLMFRTDLPDGRGMLFVMEDTRDVGFWMKNTPLPLDLLFIGADGRVKAILQGEPFSEAVISPEEPVRFVLELKAGTAAGAGIAEGDHIRHPLIDGSRNAG